MTAPTSDFESLAQIIARVAEYNAKRRPAKARRLNRHLLLFIGAAIVAVWNAAQIVDVIRWGEAGFPRSDWLNLVGMNPVDPYATKAFVWSTPAAWIWVGLVQPLGPLLWRLLHVAAVATIPDRRVVLLVLASYPFWSDVGNGNILSFVLVLGWFALAGKRWAVVGFVVLAVLVPRPLMVPVLLWLLWHRTDARWAFGIAAVTVLGVQLGTGTLGGWIGHLTAVGTAEQTAPWNLSPSRWIGYAWVVVAWPLAALAFRRGRLGLASVLATPYLTPYYLLALGWDYVTLPRKAIENSGEMPTS